MYLLPRFDSLLPLPCPWTNVRVTFTVNFTSSTCKHFCPQISAVIWITTWHSRKVPFSKWALKDITNHRSSVRDSYNGWQVHVINCAIKKHPTCDDSCWCLWRTFQMRHNMSSHRHVQWGQSGRKSLQTVVCLTLFWCPFMQDRGAGIKDWANQFHEDLDS